ncbi:MAG TPA: hypothetical protein VFU08_09625 [Candidatus Udaeobacter sp.]|nr:hypothetical protein [Candidatus Udaeobacter sp.]
MTGFCLQFAGPIAYPKTQKSWQVIWKKNFDAAPKPGGNGTIWLQWYFPDEEAHDYAEELTQVAEGRKRETERSPHEIRREMKLLANIEALINARRLFVTIAA